LSVKQFEKLIVLSKRQELTFNDPGETILADEWSSPSKFREAAPVGPRLTAHRRTGRSGWKALANQSGLDRVRWLNASHDA
jgi:hypothetical protein